jgi:hypothetical protein
MTKLIVELHNLANATNSHASGIRKISGNTVRK